jgi:hypothetical protein
MVLLTEQERILSKEANLINDATNRLISGTSMATIHDWGNATLSEAGILLTLFDLSGYGSASNTYVRFKVGSLYFYAVVRTTATYATYGAAIYLAAGTYDVLVEGCTTPSGSGAIRNVQVGFCKFNDLQGSADAVYSNSIALTVANRTTPAGPLSQATYLVQCFADTPAGVTNFEDVGDNLTNGVSVTIDGVQLNWDEKNQDADSKQAASARVSLPCTVGSSHTVAISKRNANTVVNISVIACPWILPSSNYSPVQITFSQGSTLYCTLNALFIDPTKFAGIGVVRGVDFGISYDYYNSVSGIGLIQYSYTIDVADISQVNVILNGLGGCIEIIGVDAR